MFKNILNTFFTKIITAIFSLFIIIINSKSLGAGGVGEISLIILAVSVYLLINEFFSGAYVYFVPRTDNFQLLLIAYTGAIISLLPFYLLYLWIPLAPVKYVCYVLGLSFILALSSVNQLILLGREDIRGRNLVMFVQIFIVLISLLYFFYVVKKTEVLSYIYSLYFGYSASFIVSVFKIKKYINPGTLKFSKKLFLKTIQLGAYNAFSNLIQKMNYRLSYYFIEYFLGIKALGRFSVGVQISESTWLIGQSISSVQYARISNLDNNKKAVELTLILMKIIFVLSSLMILFFTFLPEHFYLFVFGNDFSGINFIIAFLAPGIVALSCNMILSHYFSGTGQYKINTFASLTGLFFTVVFGLILIPKYQLAGAGITMSVAYIASSIYLAVVFFLKNKISFQKIFISKNELLFAVQFIKQEFLKIFR